MKYLQVRFWSIFVLTASLALVFAYIPASKNMYKKITASQQPRA